MRIGTLSIELVPHPSFERSYHWELPLLRGRGRQFVGEPVFFGVGEAGPVFFSLVQREGDQNLFSPSAHFPHYFQ